MGALAAGRQNGGASMTQQQLAAPKTFDYRVLPSTVADEMRERAKRIYHLRRAAVLELGRELIAGKAQVEPGHFIEWVRTACQMDIRTAQRAMRAAEIVGAYDNLSYLPPDGLLALAAKSAPEPMVKEVIEEIEAGERPSAAQIKRRIIEAVKAEKLATKGQWVQQDADTETAADVEERLEAAKKAAALLLGWSRFDEFMSVLKKTDLSLVERALTEGTAARPPAGPHTGGQHFEPAAGPRISSEHVEPAANVRAEISEADAVVDARIIDELSTLLSSLTPEAQACGIKWLHDKCPVATDPNEHYTIAEELLPFRAVASKVGPAERRRLVEIVINVTDLGTAGAATMGAGHG